MRVAGTKGIYEDLGVKPIINAMGIMTMLGGSTIGPRVRAAMEEANESFVDMADLLDKSGRAIAGLLGSEAALVTSGAFAALVLGAAGIMTGKDHERIARLPDVSGMKNEFLIQASVRYHYDRAPSVAGGRLVEVGDQRGTTADQLRAGIGARTAAILHAARSDDTAGVLPTADVIRIAKEKHVPVLLDAAAEVHPLQRMKWLASECGAELVCFGAKYVGAMNSAGILCGTRERIEAAVLNNFIAYETYDNRALGRGFKIDRQEIAGTVVALREWLAMDHTARLAAQERSIQGIAAALAGLPHVRAERMSYRAWLVLRVTFEKGSGKTAAAVEKALREGDPSIRVRLEGDEFWVSVHTLKEGEAAIVAQRLRQVIAG
ncbi:MAG: aminotransferase class V-fold PLP-dependent enzyme [Armatimonadota bacterium]